MFCRKVLGRGFDSRRLHQTSLEAASRQATRLLGEEDMRQNNIEIPRDKIADFCRRHHIRRLALFGSVLRDDFQPDSDVDILVEFEAGHSPGLAFFSMEEELSELLGRKAELHTPNFLSRYFRDKVQAEAETQYAEG